MSTTLGQMILAACRVHAEATAIESVGSSISYRDLADQIVALSRQLHDAGVQASEPIVVMVSNAPIDLAAFAAIWNAGAVVVPVHRANPAATIAELLQATGARIAIDADANAGLPSSWRQHGQLRIGPLNPPTPRELLSGAALILFTSGSTGRPKGVVLSHQAFAGKLDTIDSLANFQAGQRSLLVLNLSFVFANWLSLLVLRSGGTLLMHARFTASEFIEALSRGDIMRVGVVPTMMRSLLAQNSNDPATKTLIAPALRQLLIGGESLDARLTADIESVLPDAQLINAYGLTETCGNDFYLLPSDRPRFTGCIGRPAPQIRFRIVGEDGQEVSPGEAGELQLRTPFAMSGYLDAPELTTAAFMDGWFRTGDIARLREDGVVELAGRAKEIISRGGNKVSPMEIERAFADHPQVAAVMATGVSDPMLGERIHLLVVPRHGCVIDKTELLSHAAAQLPRFKQPDAIHFASELPLGRTGKADRGTLRRRLEERGEAA
jgi:long-chain acyl-CoA synthetase